MKIATILGTRPEIIRLSVIIAKLDGRCEHTLIHTGQNFARELSDTFFAQLEIRSPDHCLGVRGESFGARIGQIIEQSEALLRDIAPDRLLLLGDTDSALSAVVAKRLGIPVYHMEAGNRCYDDRVPEEVNRRIIDHSSDLLMPYTDRSRQNLLKEGISDERIVVTGNPILEVIRRHDEGIAASSILSDLGLKERGYFLVTMHRAENVDVEERLVGLTTALDRIQKEYDQPVVVSTHPRTRTRLAAFGVGVENTDVRFLDPFGFFEFLSLEQNAKCVLSDSGTVQEECCILRVPNATIRDVTERPETIDCGSNVLAGADPDMIMRCVHQVLGKECDWTPPAEYLAEDVSDRVIEVILRPGA